MFLEWKLLHLHLDQTGVQKRNKDRKGKRKEKKEMFCDLGLHAGLCHKNIINHEIPSNSYINYYINE